MFNIDFDLGLELENILFLLNFSFSYPNFLTTMIFWLFYLKNII